MIKILPSTNPCDEDKLVDYARELSNLGVEYLHCDVMDGKFVKSTCLSADRVKEVRNNVNILLDVHLMVEKPLKRVKEFAKLKPSIITIHFEACNDREFKKIINYLKSKDILIGVSIKPGTDVEVLKRFIDYIDLILIMSVEPGKSGQTFIESTYEKIEKVKTLTKDRDIIIEVDGGVNLDNIEKLKKLGVNFAVVGSAIFNAKNRRDFLTSCDKRYGTK